MKNIKLIFISAAICALLASCGMNTARNNANTTKTSPAPTSTASGNVSNSTKNAAENAVDSTGNAVKDAGDTAGNVVQDAGNAAGNVVRDAGDVVEDTVEGVGDAVGVNDANGNGR